MVDCKYHLDINNASLFTNCIFNTFGLVDDIKKGYILLPTIKYMDDYKKAKEEGSLQLFLQSLEEDIIREYLVDNKSKSLKLI